MERTLTFIKPDCFETNCVGKVIAKIEAAGFKIVEMKMMRLTDDQAGEFYAVHKERPFFGELKDYVTRGPILAMLLEKENAVVDYRELMGATDPTQAEKGTLRGDFGQSLEANVVHGSDSKENAVIETAFFFGKN